MYTEYFIKTTDRVLGHEGNYVNNPNDPGGETNWGISKRSYPRVDIKNLTRDGAIKIYWEDFWQPINGDGLPFSVAYQLYDFAINSGIPTAIRHLQDVVGVASDGHWGPVSMLALSKMSESDLVILLLADRLDFMTRLSNWKDASKGWARRIAGNLRYAAQDTD